MSERSKAERRRREAGRANARTAVRAETLGDTARGVILRRLREAARLLKSAAAEWAPIEEALREALDRARAMELTQVLERQRRGGAREQQVHEAQAVAGDGIAASAGDVDQSAGQPRSILSCSALSATAVAGEPVREFLLIPFGDVAVERPVAGESFTFTRGHAESVVAWFERMGRKLAIDYEHQTFDRFNTRSDGLRPAAGWIGKLEVRGDGLWASDVAWTPRAAELLRSGEYRYFSPVIFWTDEDQSDVAALGPVALTNDPAMHGVQALAARRRGSVAMPEVEPDPSGDEALAGRSPEANAVRTNAGRDADDDPDVAGPAAWRRQLASAHAEIALLTRKLALQEADAFVERGMRLGKIVDSTSLDWRDDYLNEPRKAEERLSRAPVLLAPGRIIKLDRRGQVQQSARLDGDFARNAEFYREWGIEPADIAAYERALATGRVKRGAASA